MGTWDAQIAVMFGLNGNASGCPHDILERAAQEKESAKNKKDEDNNPEDEQNQQPPAQE